MIALTSTALLLSINDNLFSVYLQEKSALLDRRTFLKLASTGCDRFDLNRSAWALETEPKQVAGLVYW